LYSLSNVGSLMALLTYPFVFEPRFTLSTQIVAWSAGYALFVALGAWCAILFARIWSRSAAPVAEAAPAPRPAPKTILLWLALAACGSVMLLATTNRLCLEVTSVPFLWVVPLSLYLLTFIICFDHERWYHPATFAVLLVAAVVLACLAIVAGSGLGFRWQLAIYSATLFACCMVCHGELVLAKPAPRHLTLFYLMVAAGGALGGLLVAVVAPLVLRGFWEFQIGLVATVALAVVASLRRSKRAAKIPRSAFVGGALLAATLAIAIGLVVGRSRSRGQETLESARNFYGLLRVNKEESTRNDNGPFRAFVHGSIQHGLQYVDPDKRNWPTSYYGPASGIGLALSRHPRRSAPDQAQHALRIGILGLGTGTVAIYGQKGDYLRFYEINPEVIRLAEKYFTYLSDTRARVEIVLGDARIKMEQELADGKSQRFDLLAIDAFSSDAVPMHLLTCQAVETYFAHLKPDGILCINISNRFVDLAGVVLGIARQVGYPCVLIGNAPDESRGVNAANWVILTHNWQFLADPVVAEAFQPCWPEHGEPLVWTDDYGSLWQLLSVD
jgi:hypothetical protein